jgi:hypothetical protein
MPLSPGIISLICVMAVIPFTLLLVAGVWWLRKRSDQTSSTNHKQHIELERANTEHVGSNSTIDSPEPSPPGSRTGLIKSGVEDPNGRSSLGPLFPPTTIPDEIADWTTYHIGVLVSDEKSWRTKRNIPLEQDVVDLLKPKERAIYKLYFVFSITHAPIRFLISEKSFFQFARESYIKQKIIVVDEDPITDSPGFDWFPWQRAKWET